MSNAVLQGRYDDYPRRRGHTRIAELHDAGVTIGIGQDDVVDLFHSYGDGDPLKTAFVLVHLAHMNGQDDVETLWRMLTEANASVYGVESYGIEDGNEGSLVVYDGRSPFDVLRTQSPRTLVLKDGVPVARTERTTEIQWDGVQRRIDFDRPER
jgi:cytosine deaminase